MTVTFGFSQGWTGKVFFTGRVGARPRIYGVGWGTYCVYQLIKIVCENKGNLDFQYVK